jgi:hypothetical protein
MRSSQDAFSGPSPTGKKSIETLDRIKEVAAIGVDVIKVDIERHDTDS